MSQEYNDTIKKPKRTPRSQRNRPVLVTANDTANNNELSEQPASEETTTSTQVAEPEQADQPRTRGRRLPGFFSTVGKKEEESTEKETAVKARLARATRGKTTEQSNTSKQADKEEKSSSSKPAQPASRQPARPSGPFKTRHIVGIAIYLLVANFVGLYETQFLNEYHLNQTLAKFPLFGGTVIVQTSTLAFLATLIIILVLLARFDLIPRSLGALSGTPASSSRSSANSNRGGDTTAGARQIPPPMKQGVKGEHDDLYQEYRASQRRSKKR
jgi:hypothetical protein